MSYYLESALYLFTCLLAFLMGLKRLAILDRAFRIFVLITGITFIGELLALYSAIVFHNNLIIYNIMKLFIVILICLYFNAFISVFRKYRVGVILSALTGIVWTVSLIFEHSLSVINTAFMAYEGIITIGMSIFSMEYIISRRADKFFKLQNSPHFSLACILLAYWCFTIVQWVLYNYFSLGTRWFDFLELSLTIVSMLLNIGVAVIFFFYPKMKEQHAA